MPFNYSVSVQPIATDVTQLLLDVAANLTAIQLNETEAAAANRDTLAAIDAGTIIADVTGINGDPMRGTDAAATAANLAVIFGLLDPEIAEILADVTGIAGAPMRGTDVAETEANAAARDAAMQTDLTNIEADTVAILADVTGIAGDPMRGTEDAFLAASFIPDVDFARSDLAAAATLTLNKSATWTKVFFNMIGATITGQNLRQIGCSVLSLNSCSIKNDHDEAVNVGIMAMRVT